MHIFNASSLAVLSCIAMIGATPIGGRSPAEAPDEYVALQQFMEILTFFSLPYNPYPNPFNIPGVPYGPYLRHHKHKIPTSSEGCLIPSPSLRDLPPSVVLCPTPPPQVTPQPVK